MPELPEGTGPPLLAVDLATAGPQTASRHTIKTTANRFIDPSIRTTGAQADTRRDFSCHDRQHQHANIYRTQPEYDKSDSEGYRCGAADVAELAGGRATNVKASRPLIDIKLELSLNLTSASDAAVRHKLGHKRVVPDLEGQ